jgi:GST-like protein
VNSSTRVYTPPKVWTWNKANGGRFANINRPIAGPTHDKELPVGRHPLQLYSLATPNGVKVTIMLEELLALGHSGAEYDAWLIRISEGDQFGSGFVAVNPNSKIPALMDRSGPKPIRVFESGAILLHLAEKFGAFLPTEPSRARRMPVLAVLADGQRAVISAAASAISMPTRRPRSNTRSTASRWR